MRWICFCLLGLNVAHIINKQHALNITGAYLVQENFNTGDYLKGFGLMFRLIININKDYEYVPARYINF